MVGKMYPFFEFTGYLKAHYRGHSRILIIGVQNTHGTRLIVGNDGNCKGLRY